MTGLLELDLSNNAFNELPEGLAACSRCVLGAACWGCLLLRRQMHVGLLLLLLLIYGMKIERPTHAAARPAAPLLPPQCSLRELQMSGYLLLLDVRAAERVEAALPHLERLTLPANPDFKDRAMLHAHTEGLHRLAQLLGHRLSIE